MLLFLCPSHDSILWVEGRIGLTLTWNSRWTKDLVFSLLNKCIRIVGGDFSCPFLDLFIGKGIKRCLTGTMAGGISDRITRQVDWLHGC